MWSLHTHMIRASVLTFILYVLSLDRLGAGVSDESRGGAWRRYSNEPGMTSCRIPALTSTQPFLKARLQSICRTSVWDEGAELMKKTYGVEFTIRPLRDASHSADPAVTALSHVTSAASPRLVLIKNKSHGTDGGLEGQGHAAWTLGCPYHPSTEGFTALNTHKELRTQISTGSSVTPLQRP